MRLDVYKWNNIRIKIAGNKKDFIARISKYLHADRLNDETGSHEIGISAYDSGEGMLPPLKKDARLRRSDTINLEKDIRLDIYSHGDQFWYFYEGVADYWYDLKKNELVISFHKGMFSFDYYNTLFFFLYPLGVLLENFGYFRIHSSCVDIDGRSFLITGQSGSGKSTSAFALALNGGNIVSDDLTFVKRQGSIYTTHTITRLVKLYDRTIKKFFPELLKLDSTVNNEGELYFDENLINPGRTGRSELEYIIILEKTEKNESDIHRVKPSRVISHLFPSSIQLNNGRYTRTKFDFLTDMLIDIPCYKARFGTDMKNFYKKILDLMGGRGNEK